MRSRGVVSHGLRLGPGPASLRPLGANVRQCGGHQALTTMRYSNECNQGEQPRRGRTTVRRATLGDTVTEWWASVVAWLLGLGEDLATLSIFVALAASAVTIWRRTLGRRIALTETLLSLSTGMQVDYFIEKLGTPAFRTDRDDGQDLVWVHPDAFVRAITERGTVKLCAITTRSRRFSPTLMKDHTISADGETLEIKLGRTTFGALPFGPTHIYGGTGARRWGYSEVFYFGNPGAYQRYVYSLSDAGWFPPASGELFAAVRQVGTVAAGGPTDHTNALDELPPPVLEQRPTAVFNTFTMVAPVSELSDLEQVGVTPGADLDLVRLARLPQGNRKRSLRQFLGWR